LAPLNIPIYLNDYCVSSKTGEADQCSSIIKYDYMSNDEANFEYWKINAYFKLIDSVINSMKNRFE